ncbi:MAG: hypothetical protein WA709_20930 [Stellaceae bacterium]
MAAGQSLEESARLCGERMLAAVKGAVNRHHQPAVTAAGDCPKNPARRPHHAVGEQHAWRAADGRAYLRIARFFAGLRAKAEQLDAVQRWYRILSEALRKYLRGRQLIPPARLQPG